MVNLTFQHACVNVVNQFLRFVMNRLSPLIVRRTGPWAAALSYEPDMPFAGTDAGEWLDNLRLFATGWIGGLIFFGTFFS